MDTMHFIITQQMKNIVCSSFLLCFFVDTSIPVAYNTQPSHE